MRANAATRWLEWIGELPSDWEVRDLGREAWVRARLGWKGLTADEYVPEGIPLLATPNIKNPSIDFEGANKINEHRYQESPEIMLNNGDVLLTKDGSTIGTVNVVRDLPGPATVNGSIAVLTPTGELSGRFLYWFIASHYAQSLFDRLRGGMGVPHLFQRDINRIKIPFPPPAQQVAIADYLDRETARIDTLVAEQQVFIELLRERRDAYWEKSLSLDAPNLPLRRVLESIVDGPFGSALTSSHYADSGVRVIRLGNIGLLEFKAADEAYISEEYAEALSQHAAQAGDVVIAGLGDEKMPLGRATVVPPSLGPAIVKADCYRARPNHLVDPNYLAAALSAPQTRRQIALLARGSTRARLNTKVVKQVIIPVPRLEDQRSIVASLEATMLKTDRLMAEADRLIALAQERRSALITAAVTGQIDVGAAV